MITLVLRLIKVVLIIEIQTQLLMLVNLTLTKLKLLGEWYPMSKRLVKLKVVIWVIKDSVIWYRHVAFGRRLLALS
jgi:hypothetical protein